MQDLYPNCRTDCAIPSFSGGIRSEDQDACKVAVTIKEISTAVMEMERVEGRGGAKKATTFIICGSVAPSKSQSLYISR
jgi:hypothetical protein